ncbi:glycosyltransferase family 4 protein [Rhodoferax sp.]|uniref:glycosyltransferase family 4 protein n=1 Tax=Rhodoferax sp. TaxID=50421 RepID=UPI002ACEF5A5|nr:glycosyltransferase family 4 protein [Rhodoferax sp.]MDZ7922000.1 glycosyltransferase family 4 protein [Rhodoferax sp.]
MTAADKGVAAGAECATEQDATEPVMVRGKAGERRPMVIAIVTSIHPDFDARVWRHAKLLAASGHVVHLVAPWSVEPGLGRDGVIFHPFHKPQSRAARLLNVPRHLLPSLWRILGEVDVVHFHDIDLLPWMTVLALFKPVVYDVHENYPDEMLVREWIPTLFRRPLAWGVRWGQWCCARIIRNIVLVAPSQEPDFGALGLRKTYIFNYASLALIDSAKSDWAQREPRVVFIGAHHENNGSWLLLDIAERLQIRAPNIRVITTGRFFDENFRLQFVEAIGARGLINVDLLPPVKPPQIMDVLNQATIAISPNLRVPQQIKGIHTKIFEYMAAGLPIVISDLPHQMEVVARNRAGLMARPEDVDTFVDAVLRLTHDPALALEMGQAGQQAYISRYSYESQLSDILRFYVALIPAKKRVGI